MMNLIKLLLISLMILFSTNNYAQHREEFQSPSFSKEPLGELYKIVGWNFAPDGKWVEENNLIAPEIASYNKKLRRNGKHSIGLDNTERLILQKVITKNDTLIILMKLYRDGKYIFPEIEQGWEKGKSIYFYVLPKGEFDKLNSIEYDKPNIFAFKLYEAKSIRMQGWKYKKIIPKHIMKRDKYPEQLMLQIFPKKEEQIVQFLFYQWNPIYNEFNGLNNPIKQKNIYINGKMEKNGVLLSDKLFKAYYYETSFENFNQLFPILEIIPEKE